jgi:Flp pilus assembly protein TadD
MKRVAFVFLAVSIMLALPGIIAAKDVKTYVDQGVANLENGKFDQALQDFNEALKLKPGDAALYDYRGVAYRVKGLDAQAMQDFNRAIELDPKYARAYRNRAMVYFDQSDYDKSVADQEKAQSLGYKVDPDFLKLTKRKAAEKR